MRGVANLPVTMQKRSYARRVERVIKCVQLLERDGSEVADQETDVLEWTESRCPEWRATGDSCGV